MNDLFTVLIILAFIISFLNKIFGKKKEQPTTRRQPIPQQKQPEWLPPWLQMDESEAQLPSEREESLDIIEEIEHKQTAIERQEKLKPIPKQPITAEKILFQEKREATVRTQVKPLKALGIELSSLNELKRGIVLAEILGPCRARRKLKK